MNAQGRMQRAHHSACSSYMWRNVVYLGLLCQHVVDLLRRHLRLPALAKWCAWAASPGRGAAVRLRSRSLKLIVAALPVAAVERLSVGAVRQEASLPGVSSCLYAAGAARALITCPCMPASAPVNGCRPLGSGDPFSQQTISSRASAPSFKHHALVTDGCLELATQKTRVSANTVMQA